jgi:SAM-dependent methyltransferase
MYFFDSHLFDLLHNTDTTLRLVKNDHIDIPKNFDRGTYYMASLTSEVKDIFRFLYKEIPQFNEYTFIDIGCGKGKVIFTWKLELRKISNDQMVLGVDYYSPLIEIAKSNHMAIFGDQGYFAHCDIDSLDVSMISDKLILYLYNPFDEVMLENLIQRIHVVDCFIIYVNPIHNEIIKKNNFTIVHESLGFYPSQNVLIFRRSNLIY